MTENPMVSVRDVKRHYGRVHAVDGVSLSIARGELFGLIGHNGAGKSTLFRMMLGLEGVTAGEIHIDGVPVHGRDYRAVRRSVGYLPENVVLYDNLSGLETLRFFARLKGVAESSCASALARVGLQEAAVRRVSEYSKGMRQRLGFAQALLGKPRLLFLDEPTTGLDPEAVRAFYGTLRELNAEGVTIVLTSHILAELQDRVGRLAIMSSGRVRAEGTVQALREQIDLPLRVRLVLRAGTMDAVRMALQGLSVEVVEASGDNLLLSCPRAAKMALLDIVAARRGDVHDVHVHEPSLEDVFFGLSG